MSGTATREKIIETPTVAVGSFWRRRGTTDIYVRVTKFHNDPDDKKVTYLFAHLPDKCNPRAYLTCGLDQFLDFYVRVAKLPALEGVAWGSAWEQKGSLSRPAIRVLNVDKKTRKIGFTYIKATGSWVQLGVEEFKMMFEPTDRERQ